MPARAWLRYVRLLNRFTAEEALLAELVATAPHLDRTQHQAFRGMLSRLASQDEEGETSAVTLREAGMSPAAHKARLALIGISVITVPKDG